MSGGKHAELPRLEIAPAVMVILQLLATHYGVELRELVARLAVEEAERLGIAELGLRRDEYGRSEHD